MIDIFFIFYSLSDSNFIVVYNVDGYFFCKAKENPNDIFESGNIIVTFGKNYIEIFKFSHINNDNNNINNNNNSNVKAKLEKKHEISINNNINNDKLINNNNDNDNNNEILTIQLYQNLIICGHKSGILSIWNPLNNDQFLQKKGEIQLVNCAINKIYYEKIDNEEDYLFICCASGIVHKFSFKSSQVVLSSQPFETEIMDIKKVNDFDKNNILIISLKNGGLKVLDLNLQFLYDIPSRFGYNKVRYVIGLNNPMSSQDNTKGDLLVISEGNNLDMFTWIKPGIFKVKNNHTNEHNQNNNNDVEMKFQPFQGNKFAQGFQFRGYQ